MLRKLNAWLLRRADRRLDALYPRSGTGGRPGPDRDGNGDGAGVPVPVGPRPRRDGARARPPAPPRD